MPNFVCNRPAVRTSHEGDTMTSEAAIWLGVFAVSLFALVKAADHFTESAEEVAVLLGVPSLLVGVTVVGIGTSLPELVSCIYAVISGSSEIVVGNVCGSNICNICLVLGVASVVAGRLVSDYELIDVDLPVVMAAAFYILVVGYDGTVNLPEGLIGIVGLGIYLAYCGVCGIRIDRDSTEQEQARSDSSGKKELAVQFLIIVISGVFVVLGAKYMIRSVVKLSRIFEVAPESIAQSAVALGTSLPELFVSLSAARKGQTGIGIGNVLGSNICNSFGVIGIPAMFGAIAVPEGLITMSIPFMLGASFLYFFMSQDKELPGWEGLVLMLFYVLYIAKVLALF